MGLAQAKQAHAIGRISMHAGLKAATHLPVLADPSASASHPALIAPVSRAAVAAGADGVMLDLAARSGTERGGAIDPRALEALVEDLRRVAAAGGRPT